MIRIVKKAYLHEFSNVAQIIPISGDEIIRRAKIAGENPIDWMEEHTEPYAKDFYLVSGVTKDHLKQVSCCPKLVRGGEHAIIRVVASDPADARACALRDSDLGEVTAVIREFGYPGVETFDSGKLGE